jgi:hypothetical protein
MLNNGIQHEMRQQNSPTTKQMHYKFKLEKTKINFYSKTYNLNVFWIILLTTNGSNLLSISPQTPITSKTIVVVVNGWICGGKNYEWCLLT